jgi:hypothetical protein
MPDTPTNAAASPSSPIRLDPSPSKVFSWIEWNPAVEAVLDDRGRTIQPAGPSLRVRYRYNGMEMEFFPVSEDEARRVMNPGPEFGYSIGSAVSQVLQPYKSKRVVKSGERQETRKQREEIEKREGRRWLA